MYSSYLRRMTKKYKIINEGKEGDEEGRSKKYKTIMKEKEGWSSIEDSKCAYSHRRHGRP